MSRLEETATNVCGRCGERKAIDEFSPKSGNRDGLRSQCKSCRCELERQRREADPEKYRAKKRAEYQRNPGPYVRRAKRWAEENPERRKVIALRYARRNYAKIKAWKKAHPEALRDGRRRREAIRKSRKAENGGGITRERWERIFGLADGRCVYCGVECSELQMDHFVPIARGGTTEAGNLVPACPRCNGRKSDRASKRWVRNEFGERALARVLQFLEETRE